MRPNYNGDPSLCLDQLFEAYLSFKRPLLRQSTLQAMACRYRVWVQPKLGHMRVAELDETVLADYYEKSLQEGMSRHLLHHVFSLLSQLFEYLFMLGQLRYNPQSLLHLSYLEKPCSRNALTPEQIHFLLAQTDHRYYRIFCFLLLTGLRRGEALGLCWDCVDLSEKKIHIRRQLLDMQTQNGTHTLQLVPFTKNGGSHTLLLPEPAIPILEWQKTLQQQIGAENRLNLVFTEKDGSPVRPGRVTDDFSRLMKRSGLGHAVLHSLRHTTASLVLQETGSLQVTQHMLGHKSGSATLWYCHTSQDRLADFARQIANEIDTILYNE